MPATRYSRADKARLATEAFLALLWARFMLQRTTPRDVLRLNHAASDRAASGGSRADPVAVAAGCEDVVFIIPRLAPRVPWRSDCLVQAMAGQRMLARRGIAGDIAVGTTKNAAGEFEAHAWLNASGQTILGGDVSRFEPLLRSDGA
ncbi:lasso peptide biosynthesis B2 protein [Erythrobacter colymbi]|uniref:lasso peptide biosynthesis B2 protein n=1 Tax=Erythrobacter colymbi TaxID=1161202 RepID=UPI000A37AFE6|nr:lasso peptide biosynthesis B2 protein [Erythrobacter colymbi]